MMWFWILCVATAAVYSAEGAGAGAARLVCYVESARASDFTECTHLVYTGDARGDKLDTLLKDYRKNNPKLKIVLRVSETDKDLRSLLKPKHVQGIEIHDAHRSLNKTKVSDLVDSAKAALASSGGGPLFLALPAHPELLAKYYDLRNVVKKADLMMVQTHALGLVKKMTFHPSRLSGLWDMMNTDSVVDLVIGLGVPASKLVISLPATARQFLLQNETLSTPGSPTEEDEPKEIDQAELCRQLQKGRWTLERDQDLSAPYAFKDKTWISFEDASSVDVKGKYARVRGLAGLALHGADRDADTPCGPTLKASLAKVLNQQSRAPRAAVLRSLEHEILSAPSNALEALQVSPYRITQIVDSDGVIHSIREDTRTEFSCSRQGYFVHPRSCARFYRCVKFDQLSPDFTVFEFDCPAGLAFDSRYEVCVWPGSLAHSQACPGSSEIAPVPRTRFQCPQYEGYYADPENCRWFFACLDHGTVPLTAYEFRCPFGLGFDAEQLKCDWPWLVPACGNIGRYEAEAYGSSAATLTGAAGFRGQTAESVNIAAHQSLISGASLNNLVGIQGHFLTDADTFDANFIDSQEYSPEASGQIYRTETTAPGFSTSGISVESDSSNGNSGLVQATSYNENAGEEHYSSGSLILDDYRLPAASSASSNRVSFNTGKYQGNTATSAAYPRTTSGRKYQTGQYVKDNSGRYVHNPAGDRAKPYEHVDSEVKPYLHDADKYKYTGTYDADKYSGSGSSTTQSLSSGYNYPKPTTPFEDDIAYAGESGRRYQSQGYTTVIYGSSGAYVDVSSSNAGYQPGYSSSTSHGNTGSLYRLEGHFGGYIDGGVRGNAKINVQQYNSYNNADVGNYVSDSRAYAGASHTLTAGAINVGLVGKTSLVDVEEINHGNYQTGHEVVHENGQGGHVNYVSQPAVSISHVGTDSLNLDGYTFVTTPTSSGVPTTATPFAVTTSLPAVTNTYRTTYVPLAPKTSVKQVFGYKQPAVTYVQSTVVAVKQQYVTPRVEITDHSQGSDYQYQSRDYTASNTYNTGSTKESQSSGYYYSQPSTRFDVGISVSSPAPAVSVTAFKPRGFSHNQQTEHRVETGRYEYQAPVTEVPFRKAVAYTTGPSVSTYVQPTESTYTPQSYSHQTLHKVESSNVYAPSVTVKESYVRPEVIQYSTPQPAISVQPAISTYEPQTYSQQTIHKVDASQVNTYSQGGENGYEYSQPAVKYQEASVIETSSPAPAVSTYTPQSFSHQTLHKVNRQKFVPVSTTAIPSVGVVYQQPEVTVYQNPILQYTQNVTPAPVSVFTQTYKPLRTKITRPIQYPTTTQQSYIQVNSDTYNQPEIQRDIETANAATYSDASAVSHQVFHQTHDRSQSDAGKNAIFVSTSPSTLVYESHYTDYESPRTVETYKVPEYIPPKTEYQQKYSVSTISPPVVYQQGSDTHETLGYNYNTQQAIPELVESIHFSSVPRKTVPTTFNQLAYSSPEIQQGYKAEEYLPPVSSTLRPVTTTYRPRYLTTTTREYLPPTSEPKYNAPEYLPPSENTYLPPVENTYLPPASPSESLPFARKNTYLPPPSPTPESREYLPPVEKSSPSTVNFESFGYDNNGVSFDTKLGYNPYQDNGRTYFAESSSTAAPQRKQNIVVGTAKSSLLGFGTVGPDAGLVSPVSYTTSAPIVVSSTGNSYEYIQSKHVTSTYAPEIVEVTSPASRRTKPKYRRPLAKSTTQEPVYFQSSTTYKAPEYVPPSEETDELVYKKYQVFNSDDSFVSSTAAPYQRKQNIVVETAKSHALGFGTVGPDAGLVSPITYTTSAPSESYSSTYAPFKQGLGEVSGSRSSSRRNKPKVAVVTKINDFNPLLVRKLGAVCSCESPVLVLKGRRPSAQQESIDYNNYYADSGRGDIGDDSWLQKSTKYSDVSTVVTANPTTVTSTFNPIIVPDDSFYQDYQEATDTVEIISNGETYVSSTPAVSTTQKSVRIRPRVKTVTAAPSYKTVLLNQEVTPTAIVDDAAASVSVASHSFDRFGPGGWRSRDETLQGSVDCKRAGLFRHPKQCNKFYACRWDCSKQRFTLHVFNCPVQLSFDPNLGACNWPSQGPACQGDTLLTNTL